MPQDNLARNYHYAQEAIELPKKKQAPVQQTQPLTTPKTYVGLTPMEVFMIAAFAMAVFALLIFNVYSAMHTSNLNRQVQDTQEEIAQTEVTIDNLTQHVHELSSYERIFEIAKKRGLELNEDNVKNIQP